MVPTNFQAVFIKSNMKFATLQTLFLLLASTSTAFPLLSENNQDQHSLSTTQSSDIDIQLIESKSGSYHDVKTAARVARTLVHRESLTNLNTIDFNSGYPVSFVEYYADCDNDGKPIMLVVDMSSSNRNIEQGSKASLSINVGNHQIKDKVDPHYIGGIVGSTAGSPRVNFKGKFVDYEGSQTLVGACFAKRHRDSVVWYPNNPIHSSHWSKFEIEEVYFVGGFGDRAYIGILPVDEYLNAKTFDEDDENYQKFLFGDETEHQFNEGNDVNESDETSATTSLLQSLFSSLKSALNQITKEADVHANGRRAHRSGCKEHM
ncbi:unnamed protein product [Ambrosiozyma monospora]|uniref:Unnamed protein product n=1 Tax=Ambrosiozyma monospora TaxID=43982 RepID=A0A9W7DDY5_AMBMO|nr:unnamed protein product [Ambrosiozyma monospora]